MSRAWYYADCGLSIGPLSLQRLKETLGTLPDAKNVHVWCEGFLFRRAADQDRFPIVAGVRSTRLADALDLGLAVAAGQRDMDDARGHGR
jgi:hypothetical protein